MHDLGCANFLFVLKEISLVADFSDVDVYLECVYIFISRIFVGVFRWILCFCFEVLPC